MEHDKQNIDTEPPSETDERQSRREFLTLVKGWSAAVVAGVTAGVLVASDAQAGGAIWHNGRTGPGGGWGNNAWGNAWGNGPWSNWRGGYPWVNNAWINNGGGVWGNRGGGWGNRGGGRWGNWR